MQPDEIEKKSFAIISAEAGDHGLDADTWAVVARMIHTSADFEYLETVRIHPRAIAAGIDAIRNGRPVITDTNMARAGIRKSDLKTFGGEVKCYMDDPAVKQIASQKVITRAAAAVDAALDTISGGIYVVGNAPTALLRLMSHIRAETALPALIVGLPVGFVNAAESKADLLNLDVPYITNVGRKGGSNVAAAVVNSLILLARAHEAQASRGPISYGEAG